MYRITIMPTQVAAHLQQPLSGLFLLEAAGEVEVQLGSADWGTHRAILCAEISDGNTSRRVGFDMRDAARIDPAAVQELDVYFKRSLTLSEVPEGIRATVMPYGLNYGCISDTRRQRNFVDAMEEADDGKRREGGNLSHAAYKIFGPWLRRRVRSPSNPHPVGAYETSASQPADAVVLYLTRMWDPALMPGSVPEEIEALNRDRADIVRSLREGLGNRFLGGVEDTPHARAHYQDVLFDGNTNKQKYLPLMKSCLVGIATTGLHGSTGWKLPEYLAASRCVVTQPLNSTLVEPLVEGEHVLSFTDADSCLSACRQLLDDEQLAASMRRANEDYYHRALHPAALMRKRLQEVFDA